VNSHQATESEFTLVPRQPVPKVKLLNIHDVLNIVMYLWNPQNATFFEALAGDSVKVPADNTRINSEENSSDITV
jgi:hypothetical protein